MEIKIKKNFLEKAIKEFVLSENEKKKLIILMANEDGNAIDISTEDISANLLSYLIKESPGLSKTLKAKFEKDLLNKDTNIDTNAKMTIEEIWNSRVKSLADIIELFSKIGTKKINADKYFNQQWYPVIVRPTFNSASRHSEAYIDVTIGVKFADENIDLGWNIFTSNMKDEYGKLRKVTLKELFAEYGCRMQSYSLKKYEEKLAVCNSLYKLDGKQMLFAGSAFLKNTETRFQYGRLFLQKLGTETNKDRVIIEHELEYDNKIRNQDENKKAHPIPLIRVFSMSKKEYVFVDVEYLSEYKYDTKAINRLFLPDKITNILKKVFSTAKEDLVGDIVSGKHGGMIIMAWGNPGIGKTSSAEVFAELMKTPLYLLDISELGTSANNVENNLSTIFRRVEKWNTIILFDEVDVFLSQRDTDLERSAIVGIFLRMMDYFQGVMFFTTNRPEVIDNAIHSRITLNIAYPDLSENIKAKIWNEKLTSAGIEISDEVNKLAALALNGREIRNVVRLIKIVLGNNITQNKVID